MTSRRAFIHAGFAAASATLLTPVVHAIAVKQPATLPLHAIYFDERFAPAREFGRAAARLGGRTQAMSGTVHDFWYYDLAPRWRTQPIAIAGMTDPQAIFLLEMMAADAGMRVVFRGHHVPQSEGRYTHEGFGPPAARSAMAAFDGPTTAWSANVARIVADWPLAACSVAAGSGTNVNAAAGRAVGCDTLVSWVIAPVHRA